MLNALQQVIETIYIQKSRFLEQNAVSPQDVTVRISVNFNLRCELRRNAQLNEVDTGPENGFKETIVGEPLEVGKDIPDDTYYLDIIVYNRVQKQLKFTVRVE